MNLYHVDLHIHTVLSPCADWTWGHGDHFARCRDEGIDMIAITDHNSARNYRSAVKGFCGLVSRFINGLEYSSSEDIHIICLMPDGETAGVSSKSGSWNGCPDIRNIPSKFGRSSFIDEKNIITGESGILLGAGH